MVWTARAGARTDGGPLLERVMAARGLAGLDQDTFLNPRLTQLHNPSQLPGLERAAERILRAAHAGEPIAIYGDYDADGCTATAILVRTLRALFPTLDVRTYVPHRLDEGYGLNSEAIAKLTSDGARVIVSVDCGITAIGPARAARESGVDLIITDHHNPLGHEPDGGPWPEAYAIVHPRVPHDTLRYPFHDLCGAGVAYKLAWRLCTMHTGTDKLPAALRNLLIDLLALTSLGVIADVVPLKDENRVIARFGLPRIASSPFVGLSALVRASNLDGENIDTEAVGFRLAPRLNASGRLGHAREAVELLTTDDPARAMRIAQELTRQNNERRETERRILEQAIERAEAEGMTSPDRRAIVLADERWHAGVVGIVCSRLVERYHRPTILLSISDGEAHGSGRSVEGFNLHGAIKEASGPLTTFGGHDMAAGLKLPAERMPEFVELFIAEANRRLAPEELVGKSHFDSVAQLGELSPAAVGDMLALGPFGRENPMVRLVIESAEVASDAKLIGSQANHTKVRLRDATLPGGMDFLCWQSPDLAPVLRRGVRVDALVVPKISTFRGYATVEPQLVDVRLK
ncbi:MAG: single-stranded-DNA-specific exonuclease RecJ [Planctomycetota bacterium]|nr:single-stranded-DNA-specific exonuclease RecJ [Planctomycetota bacterium]